MPEAIIINGVVCKLGRNKPVWKVSRTIYCHYCRIITWAYKGTTIDRESLKLYSTPPFKILHETSTHNYIAYCSSGECTKALELDLVCPHIP